MSSAPELSVTLSTGERAACGRLRLCVRPLAAAVCSRQAIGARIRPTRQEVLYFGVAGRARRRRLPVWIDFAAGLYGLPDVDGTRVQSRHRSPRPVGRSRHGRRVSSIRRRCSRRGSWLGRRFPVLRDAALVEARVCQYENTSSGDFIIDRHPQWPQCWIVGGGSGHGFKHGPSVGRHVAALVERRGGGQSRAFRSRTSQRRRARRVWEARAGSHLVCDDAFRQKLTQLLDLLAVLRPVAGLLRRDARGRRSRVLRPPARSIPAW